MYLACRSDPRGGPPTVYYSPTRHDTMNLKMRHELVSSEERGGGRGPGGTNQSKFQIWRWAGARVTRQRIVVSELNVPRAQGIT